jgi:hypothetical protein
MPGKSMALFELSLYADNGRYALAARFASPQHDERCAAYASFDVAALRGETLDPDSYGRLLTAQVFADKELRKFWDTARAVAFQSGTLALRLRLPGALHVLRWETLRDPEDDTPFALNQRVTVARTLDGGDFTPLPLVPRPETLRALVIVAAPGDLANYNLAEIDADGEVARVRAALGDIPCTLLGDTAGAIGRATLEAIQEALNSGPELVFLIAHGKLDDEARAVLYLENRNGLTEAVFGDDLVQAVARQARRPLLFNLISCRGAGDDYAALSAVGPRLAREGLAAVLAFQGDIAMAATKRLLPALISELKRDGVIDRALAAARAALGRGGPWWQPVLFLRGDGRLWQEPAAPQQGGGIHIAGNVGNVQQITVNGGSVGSIIGQQVHSPDGSAANSDVAKPLIERIGTHRETIAHYLGQIAMVGEANARPEATHGIRQARSEIKRIKAYLTKIGVHVADHPDDE